MGSIRDELGTELARHTLDTMSQDSGMQCICGSDSRFEQRKGDHPWTTFGQHLADVALNLIGV